MLHNNKSVFFLCLVIFFTVVSCGNNSAVVNVDTVSQPTFISPTTETTDLISPISPMNYVQNKIPTEIIEPLLPLQATIEGTGTPGITIAVVDVTQVDKVIGTGTISQDGTFAIDVTPLKQRHRIGLMLISPDGVELQYKDFLGDGAVDIPMIGLFLDTVWVSDNSTTQ